MTFAQNATCASLALLALSQIPAFAELDPACRACDRELRKTLEAIQAWRRLHNGAYPEYIADLKLAGMLPADGGICPEVLREHGGASATQVGIIRSAADFADPPGIYQYEMSAKVDKYAIEKPYLPANALPYTSQDIKSALLSRPFFEQVPILRCLSHRDAAPKQFTGPGDAYRNLTVEGKVYWSKLYWEQLWLDDVPYCARESMVWFGLKGPPFYADRAPTLACALDLRKWSCAFGDHAWWWTLPMFDVGTNRQFAAHLRPFFQENHGRVLRLDETDWWLNGLVQLQGRTMRKGENIYNAPGMEAFAWKKNGAVVGRKFGRAAWLQGTVWTATPGDTTGWLVWHYAGGDTERVPIIYGRNTARFWIYNRNIQARRESVEPVWRFHESKADVYQDRWLRIYEQDWNNPRPEAMVESLDFVSNPDCRAAPFLIAVNVYP